MAAPSRNRSGEMEVAEAMDGTNDAPSPSPSPARSCVRAALEGLRHLLQSRNIASTAARRSAIPPATAPTMAPIGILEDGDLEGLSELLVDAGVLEDGD